MSKKIKCTVEKWVNEVDYKNYDTYVPSKFALEFVNFIKLVNGADGEEHKTPIMHMKMLDQIAGGKESIANLCYRGAAKTTVMAEYLFLYLAVYGSIPGFGEVTIAIYVSDSIENGVKNLRKNLEYRWGNSEFLQKYVPKIRFTDVRYEFENIDGKKLIVKSYGAKTGVRGAKEQGRRVDLAILDDLLSDDDARSPTVIKSIEDTVYKAIDYALHPSKSKVIWSGTPFNQNDPLYKAIESGGWYVNVYPVCEHFDANTTKDTFVGAWADRHDFKYVKGKYDKAVATGQIDSFNQELMLRIMSDEDRLISDNDIVWYSRYDVLKFRSNYNFYITTDFATSEKTSADFSVISVWAYNNNGDWLWVDGTVKRQTMDKNLDDLFRFAAMYKPDSVGVEVTGQQGGFIQWIREQQISRNIFFKLASDGNSNREGIRPNTNKMVRFNTVVPLFKAKKIWFPKELENSPEVLEAINELRNASAGGFKSKHDDFIDTISMLSVMAPWKPSEPTGLEYNADVGVWEDNDYSDESNCINSYIV